MPIFHLRTNVKNVPESFISKVSKEVATLTNKEEAKVMVIVEDNIKITFGSSGKLFLSLLMYIVNIYRFFISHGLSYDSDQTGTINFYQVMI